MLIECDQSDIDLNALKTDLKILNLWQAPYFPWEYQVTVVPGRLHSINNYPVGMRAVVVLLLGCISQHLALYLHNDEPWGLLLPSQQEVGELQLAPIWGDHHVSLFVRHGITKQIQIPTQEYFILDVTEWVSWRNLHIYQTLFYVRVRGDWGR